MSAFWTLVGRDVRLAWSQGNSSMLAVAFFFITVTLFPLGIGPELDLLGRIAAGVIWVALLLSTLLSLDRMFQIDLEDGSLDQLMLAPLVPELMVLAKILAHWLTTAVPLVLAAPFLALLLNLEAAGYLPLVLSLLIGTPALSLIGAIGAALTVLVKRGGVLLTLIVLPLFVPILIFGVGAVDAAVHGSPWGAALVWLAAITLAALALAPVATAWALRYALE